MLIVLMNNSYSQWQPDIRLTNSSGNSSTTENNVWSVAVYGDTIHVIWYDDRDGNTEIYYKRSTDGGISWGSDIRMTNNSANSTNSAISVSGSTVHVVWQDDRDGNFEIYYKRSIDAGVTWGTDTRLTTESSTSERPCIASIGSFVDIVWTDNRNYNPEIYNKRSTDGGVSWDTDLRLTINTGNKYYPCVAISDSVLHVVWQDDRNGTANTYYKRSTNRGLNWGSDIRLANDSYASGIPCISALGSTVIAIWEQDYYGKPERYQETKARKEDELLD